MAYSNRSDNRKEKGNENAGNFPAGTIVHKEPSKGVYEL